MKAAFTPGPWSQSHRKSGNGYSTEVYCAAGQTIAILAWYPVPTPAGIATSREANAKLIAAAPDLMAALRECLACEFAVTDRTAIATAEAVYSAALDTAWARVRDSYGR